MSAAARQPEDAKLSLDQLAKVWRVSKATAWRRAIDIEQNNPGVFARGKGNRLTTTASAIRPYMQHRVRKADPYLAEMRTLRQAVRDYERRVDAMAISVSSIRRQVDEVCAKLRIGAASK